MDGSEPHERMTVDMAYREYFAKLARTSTTIAEILNELEERKARGHDLTPQERRTHSGWSEVLGNIAQSEFDLRQRYEPPRHREPGA